MLQIKGKNKLNATNLREKKSLLVCSSVDNIEDTKWII